MTIQQNASRPEAADTTRSLKLNVIQVDQGQHQLLLAKMKAGDFRAFTEIDPYDPGLDKNDPDQGYQRLPGIPRIKRFGNWLAGTGQEVKPLMPTALLLSFRDHPVQVGEDGSITLTANRRLKIVDGQHRVQAYKYAIHEKGKEELKHAEVPVIILNGVCKLDEMEQFRTVNQEAKSVPTELVNMLLATRAEAFGENAVVEKDRWKVVANDAAETLNSSDESPFYRLIVMPNESVPKAKEIRENPLLARERLVKMTSFQVSLKPLIFPYGNSVLDVHYFDRGWTAEKKSSTLVAIIDSFWGALEELLPECFTSPRDYVLFKTPGIFSLNSLLPEVLKDLLRDQVNLLSYKEEMVARLRGMPALAPEFWKADSGHASAFGSMKGFKKLGDELSEEYQEHKPRR